MNDKSQEVDSEKGSGEVNEVKSKDLNEVEFSGRDAQDLKLDKHGLPLVPQPTAHKDDPLVSQPNYGQFHSNNCCRTGLPCSSYL